MRASLSLAAMALLFTAAGATGGGEAPAVVRQVMFKLHVYQGDPLGSVEARTIKVLSEPVLVTAENRPFSLHRGDEVPISSGSGKETIESGYSITGTPGVFKDGKLRLDLTIKNTTVTENNDDRLAVQSETTRTISTVKEGGVVKARIGKAAADAGEQLWMEFSYELIQEFNAHESAASSN